MALRLGVDSSKSTSGDTLNTVCAGDSTVCGGAPESAADDERNAGPGPAALCDGEAGWLSPFASTVVNMGAALITFSSALSVKDGFRARRTRARTALRLSRLLRDTELTVLVTLSLLGLRASACWSGEPAPAAPAAAGVLSSCGCKATLTLDCGECELDVAGVSASAALLSLLCPFNCFGLSSCAAAAGVLSACCGWSSSAFTSVSSLAASLAAGFRVSTTGLFLGCPFLADALSVLDVIPRRLRERADTRHHEHASTPQKATKKRKCAPEHNESLKGECPVPRADVGRLLEVLLPVRGVAAREVVLFFLGDSTREEAARPSRDLEALRAGGLRVSLPVLALLLSTLLLRRVALELALVRPPARVLDEVEVGLSVVKNPLIGFF